MKRLLTLIALAGAIGQASAQQQTPQQLQVENVVAFARLYGVARWFYPGDAAAALDWDRFAIDGVRRVRTASTPAELEQALKVLFLPLGPGIVIGPTLSPKRPEGKRDASLVAWHYHGPGITQGIPGPYSSKRTNRAVPVRAQSTGMSATMTQALPGASLRGKAIRMRGLLRVADPSAAGWTGMWMRVDLPGTAVGFFDNMEDRPVRDTVWREYVIEGRVAANAEGVMFGVLAVGAQRFDLDGINVEVREDGGEWKPVVTSDEGLSHYGSASYTRVPSGGARGGAFTRVTAASATSGAGTAPAGPADELETPITGAAVDVELARGLKARVPLSLTDADARVELPAIAGLRAELANTNASARDEVDSRVADAIVTWNVFRHFSPYWGDLTINWDERLRPQLDAAFSAPTTRDAHLDAVRTVVADLHDGHGSVRDLSGAGGVALLPLQFRILDQQLVVTASNEPGVPVGSVVTAINGTPASARMNKEIQLASGTLQWQRARAEAALATCRMDSDVTLRIEAPNGVARDAKLSCTRLSERAAETRPDKITQIRPGIWYVDLTRVSAAELTPMIGALASGRGVIFDMRGYPTDAGFAVLPYLMSGPENATDRWMHVPRFSRPFGEAAAWEDMTWNLKPANPHIGGQVVFMTDGRAISYAESVMGYVRDYKLGTIIGGTTAGANGNVASFSVPGGFGITFTGMRVTRHDGTTAYHTVGVSPDIPIVPTLAGIRAGKDEVLERALSAFRITP
ncbi:MAG TPA: S41 family peptidase [Gemmatimonadaceae bacterium]|nr:S41 family peptidase [Gemmatimonadaceae bacterium]